MLRSAFLFCRKVLTYIVMYAIMYLKRGDERLKTMSVTEFRKKQKETLDGMKHNDRLHLVRDSKVIAVVIKKD